MTVLIYQLDISKILIKKKERKAHLYIFHYKKKVSYLNEKEIKNDSHDGL